MAAEASLPAQLIITNFGRIGITSKIGTSGRIGVMVIAGFIGIIAKIGISDRIGIIGITTKIAILVELASW
jgi:hypothetical protein